MLAQYSRPTKLSYPRRFCVHVTLIVSEPVILRVKQSKQINGIFLQPIPHKSVVCLPYLSCNHYKSYPIRNEKETIVKTCFILYMVGISDLYLYLYISWLYSFLFYNIKSEKKVTVFEPMNWLWNAKRSGKCIFIYPKRLFPNICISYVRVEKDKIIEYGTRKEKKSFYFNTLRGCLSNKEFSNNSHMVAASL